MVIKAKNEVINATESILEEASKRKEQGYHLVQISATRVKGGNELIYSFGKNYDLLSLRFTVEDDREVTSISHVFPSAFMYENEIHDLFGTSFSMMTIDYKGNFYRLNKKTPYKETLKE